MRILITGSSGFVGKHVIEELIYDNVLLTPSSNHLNLLDPLSVHSYFKHNDIDAVVHLAATVAGLPGNIGNQGLFMYNNLQMALNLFEHARTAGVSKVVNLGSVCGYHDIGPKPFKEENFWKGLPHESNRGYGMAKRASIMLGIEYARQYGMNITNLVPINLVGEGDTSDHVCMDLIRKFEESEGDEVDLWGSGFATREFCYAGDLAKAISLSLNKETGAWPINIGTGKEISIRDLAKLIKDVGRYDSRIAWDVSKPEGQASRCLDISRAKDTLGWEPQTSLREALAKTIVWYRMERNV